MTRYAMMFVLLVGVVWSSQGQPAQPAPQREKMRIILVGDSTVTDNAGWGLGFKALLEDEAECTNTARGGRSSRTFREEGSWDKVMQMKADYVLIQFGHNDEPGTDRSTNLETEFPRFMRQYVEDARKAGMKPVLVTPLVRRQFKAEGKIESSLAGHAQAVKLIAREMDVPLVDLHDRSLAVCNAMGKQVCTAVLSTVKPNGQFDGTHLTPTGSALMGALVVDELRNAVPALEPFIRAVPASAAAPTTAPATTSPPTTASSTTTPGTTAPVITAPASAATQSSSKGRHLVVAIDGSGEFRTVQAAIDAVPANNKDRIVIRIKPGRYKERIEVPKNKPFVTFLGDDAKKTILTHDWNAKHIGPDGNEVGTGGSYSTKINGEDFIAENITFENTAGDTGQALAMFADADRLIFRNCRFLGWQDTLYANGGRHYYDRCHIEGRVDFIFGGATAVFDRCTIHSKNGGHITAASTPEENPFGYVFLDCKLTGAGAKADLGRPWRPFAAVAYVRCFIGDHIKPEGWDNWGKESNEQTARYSEYKCTGPGANRSKRVGWAREMNDDEAAKYTIENILAASDGWNPAQPKEADRSGSALPVESSR